MIRFAMVAAVLALGVFSTNSADAQEDRETARIQFERGVGLYETHDYQGALASFQEAYRLAPHPSVRVNMANCYEHLNRPIEALHHFERFLAESDNTPRAQRREVQAAIARMRALVGEVRLAIAPDGATVVIDEAETRRAPVLEPILLMAGEHTVTVRMDGFTTVTERVNIEGGDTQRVSIRLQRPGTGAVASADSTAAGTTDAADPGPTEASGDAATADTADDPGASDDTAVAEATADEPAYDDSDDGGGFQLRITTPVIIFGAATAGLAVGAIVTGALSLSFDGQFEDAVLRVAAATNTAERRQARADGQSAADTANALSVVTDVLLIGTIAAAGATAFFVIIEGMSDDDEVAEADGVRLMALPSVSPNGGGVSMLGQF